MVIISKTAVGLIQGPDELVELTYVTRVEVWKETPRGEGDVGTYIEGWCRR